MRRPTRQHAPRLLPILLIAALPALAGFAPADKGLRATDSRERDRQRERDHPGSAAAARFLDLADPDGRLVEVNLHGRLLKLLVTRAVGCADADLAAILKPLEYVRAVIAEVESEHADAAREEVAATAAGLERDGWERFVRVREEGNDLAAFVHFKDDEAIDGLIVMGFADRREIVFVSLVGTIDVERIALLGSRLGVPGLDDLPTKDEIERRRAENDPVGEEGRP